MESAIQEHMFPDLKEEEGGSGLQPRLLLTWPLA